MFKNIKIIFIAMLVCSAVNASQEDDAIKFVESTEPEINLKYLSVQAARNTSTFRMIVNKVGKEKAKNLLNSELDKSIIKYQNQWNRHLAHVYLEYFTPDELSSLTMDKGKSPYSGKLVKNQKEVGASMKKQSSKLLTTVVTEAVTNSYSNTIINKDG